MSDQTTPIVELPDGVNLTVKVAPRSRRNECGGIVDIANGRKAMAVRLAAPPVDGAANAALCRFLADVLKVSRSSITLRSGETGRIKLVHIRGNATEIVARLAVLCDG